jgi:hypothetical protein
MKTYADLIFCSFCDALVSSLASRAHEWIRWEILQSFQAELAPHPSERLQIVQRRIELRIQTTAHAPLRHLVTNSQCSPSAFISLALSHAALKKPADLALGPWDRAQNCLSLPRLGALHLELHDLDEALPEASVWGPEDTLGALKNDTSSPLRAFDIRYRNYIGKSLHLLHS